MQPDITNKDLQTLLTLYNQEIDKLKEKLLNGESWENLKPVRRNITELATAIHKLYGYILPNKMISEDGVSITQSDAAADQIAE